MNGDVVTVSGDGTYTFEATEQNYTIEPIYTRKLFAEDNAEWDISKQFEGRISLPEDHDGDSGWLKLYDQYKDIDFTLSVRDYIGNNSELRQVVWFEFTNGKTVSFSVTYSDGKYRVQSMNDTTFGWKTHHELSATEIASYQDENGMDFRIVRTGTMVDIYLDSVKICAGIDLTTNSSGSATNITEDMAATITIRHYGNQGNLVEIPFVIASADVVEMYDTQLFYANDRKTNIADPFVLDNIAVDGYYYLYGTQGACCCYRSKNMMDWEKVGDAIEVNDIVSTDIWAPEVVYDEESETYYMFFSATPKVDSTYTTGNAAQVLFVATSKYAYKDFSLVNFMDASSCGETNLHTYSESNYPHFYAKYLMFDPEKYDAFSDKNDGYLSAIDPHPYVDADGTKYLFWTDSRAEDRICGMKMNNWLQPDWDSAKVITYPGYYTVADWTTAQTGEDVETVSWDEAGVNEGPVVTKHGEKYYLTFSVNSYKGSDYMVLQAVSDSVLGNYRKLTEEEGGKLLVGNEEVSGPGHHSFVTVGEQTYIVYHRHNDVVAMGSGRNHAMDEVKWITIADKDGNDLEVMYVNGPTNTPQPKIEAYSDYQNIADEAQVSGTSEVSCLTDGLISENENQEIGQYIKEVVVDETTTFTFEFDSARVINAVMLYGSASVAKVEMVCEDGNIKTVAIGEEGYVDFMESRVTSVKITIEVLEGQNSIAISEIKILGK